MGRNREDCSADSIAEFSAIWVVPGSPYKNMEGVLSAIRFVREMNRPFLGTCGGFQHALIEYARNVCGVVTADHAESNPEGNILVVTQLTCSLAGKTDQIFFKPDSRLYSIFKEQSTMGDYQCRYGLNPVWKDRLESAGLLFLAMMLQEKHALSNCLIILFSAGNFFNLNFQLFVMLRTR